METRAGVDVRLAFQRCREIARREAKNFYFAFVALPRAKSDAMCAMYAFMRRADDIADEESSPVEERRALMRRWLAAFHADAAFEADDRLVFAAVRETQRRYGIGDDLLDELVAGTSMDLAEALPAGVVRVDRSAIAGVPVVGSERRGAWNVPAVFDCYETIEALDRYCYLVASVVGLVTIRIFGFTDARADAFAVRMGKAFQYTNILRDVREDAERGRVYLPLEVLERHGTGVEEVVAAARGGAVTPGLRAALEAMGGRAEELYHARDGLLPLLDRDSRPAMRVLIRIYHALLQKIRRTRYAVFGGRVRVSTVRKLAILLRGLVGSVAGRLR